MTTPKELGLKDPDSIGASEYRAIHETLAEALAGCEDEVAQPPREFAAAILNEFIRWAEDAKRQIAPPMKHLLLHFEGTVKVAVDSDHDDEGAVAEAWASVSDSDISEAASCDDTTEVPGCDMGTCWACCRERERRDQLA